MFPLDPQDRCATSQRRLIKQLRKSDVRGADCLADILARCSPAAPCGSAACYACGLKFQAAAVELVERFVRLPSREHARGRMTAITFIPTIGCVEPDELTADVFLRVRAKVKAALETVSLPPFVVGIEASFNEDLTEEVDQHWCGHAHGIGYGWLSAEQESELRAAFPRSAMVKRPILIDCLDKEINGRLYAFKPERNRRQTYLVAKPKRGRNPYRDTRRKSLRPWQAVKLAMVEHDVGFDGRLLTHGLDEGVVKQHSDGWKWARDGP